MPYITQDKRNEIIDVDSPFGNGEKFHHVIAEHIEKPGELNYAITFLIDNYLKRKGLSYTNSNEIVGVLECVNKEFYRRVVAPYEDEKIVENGDVYTVGSK